MHVQISTCRPCYASAIRRHIYSMSRSKTTRMMCSSWLIVVRDCCWAAWIAFVRFVVDRASAGPNHMLMLLWLWNVQDLKRLSKRSQLTLHSAVNELTFNLVAVFGVVVVIVLTSMTWRLNLWQNCQWCDWLRSLKLLEDWCIVVLVLLYLVATVLGQRRCRCWRDDERCRRVVWLEPLVAASFVWCHSFFWIPSDERAKRGHTREIH